MNKRLTYLIVALVLAAAIIAVANQFLINKENVKSVTFNAEVIENNVTSLLVNPEEGSPELNSSDKIVIRVPIDNAVLKDLSEFTLGSKVKIIYGGMIMESYPAQINAYSVEFMTENGADNLDAHLDDKTKEKENNYNAKKSIDLLFTPVPREALKEGKPKEEWIKAKSIIFGELLNQNATMYLCIDSDGNNDLKSGEGTIYGFIEHDRILYEVGIVSEYGIDNVDVNLADRNYDGIKEIEIAGDMGASYREMKIIAYNETNHQWENLLTMGSPEIIDLDNDGQDELIAVSTGSLPPFVDIYKWNNVCLEKADIVKSTESDFATLYMLKDEWIIETGIIKDGKAAETALYKYKERKLLLKEK